MVNLHTHGDNSLFDGLGKPHERVKLAKEYGYAAAAISDHGTTSGLVEHYSACKEEGIKPILGVEAYFMPEFSKESPRYHLCLYCKNLEGYKSLNRMLSEANINNYYYKGNVTYELLEKYHDGIICTSACIAGLHSVLVRNGKLEEAERELNRFVDIFGDDFYIEIQPYKVSEDGLQEYVNNGLMDLADKLGIKCILTSDSHYGRKTDYDTFELMHRMKAKDGQREETAEWVRQTYKERYDPTPAQLKRRFLMMHSDREDIEQRCEVYWEALGEIVEKVDGDILDQLPLTLPKYTESEDINITLMREMRKGLKAKGKLDKAHLERCREEMEVVKENSFQDYFLIVYDFINYARANGIPVGPGRGSVCNCEIAYALDIIEVDPLYFNLDFRRFLRKDKKKLPDIDVDFETSRRDEVIAYLINKYQGKAVQICSYGLYKVDNLLNDLFKVCGVDQTESKKAVKTFIKKYIEEDTENFDYNKVKDRERCKELNARYNNIIKHFSKMYRKVKYIGTHAAGVAIVGTNIYDYTAVERHDERLSSAYDLNNLERINVIKFDMLGLRTLSILNELEQVTGQKYQEEWLEDKEVYRQFAEGNTEAIFQFEKKAAASILTSIQADCIEDIIAANALNRPGPLSLKMPEQYAYNKAHKDEMQETIYYELTKDTYGTVVYQEQISAICREIGCLSWEESDKVLKLMKAKAGNESDSGERERLTSKIRHNFIEGAKSNGIDEAEADEIFSNIITYSFNKGHATGYSLIAIKLMWYKVHYPIEFWYANLKYVNKEENVWTYKRQAVLSGAVLLTPHVNGTSSYSLRKENGHLLIQMGLSSLPGVGDKAAEAIEAEKMKGGEYTSLEDLVSRLPKRNLNSKVLTLLQEVGACEFDETKYFQYVKAENLRLT